MKDQPLKEYIDSQEKALELIRDIGLDYDGCGDDVECLKELIDEMIEIAKLGLDCNDEFIHVHKYLKWLDDNGYKLELKKGENKISTPTMRGTRPISALQNSKELR